MNTALPRTPADALQHARACGIERLDAQLLLTHVTGQSRTWLLAHDRDPLQPEQAARFVDLVTRRAAGEPAAYLLGDKEFFGLTLQVTPATLIPRPDTETLVDWALEHIPEQPRADSSPFAVLDLGTGSGAIALALAHRRPHAAVTAVDASADALAVAAANARALGLPLRCLHGSWLTPVTGERFDLIVSNPPYIAEGDPHLTALTHEPITALTAGPDGLDDIRHIVAHAAAHLRPGGWLLLEHGYDQAEAVTALLRAAGFTDVATRIDLGGQPRCTGGRASITG